jgi:hypothetical protein
MKRLGGWWRLWILSSLLWGTSIAAIAWMNWPTHGEAHHLSTEEMKQLSPESYKMVHAAPVASGGIDATPKFIDLPGPPLAVRWPNGQILYLSPQAEPGQRKAFAEDYARVQGVILKEARLSHLKKHLLLWIVPCTASVLLALGLAWVARGFKGQTA